MFRSKVCSVARHEKRASTSRIIVLVAAVILSLSFIPLTGCTGLSNTPADSALKVSGSLPSGARVGVALNSVLSVSGGSSPYTFSLMSGTLPPGVTLNASSGTIAGTPSKSGTFNFEVQVIDAGGVTGTHTFQLTVATSTA